MPLNHCSSFGPASPAAIYCCFVCRRMQFSGYSRGITRELFSLSENARCSGGYLAQWLSSWQRLCSTLKYLGLILGCSSELRFLGSSSGCSSNWVPAIQIEDLDCIPDFQLGSQPSPSCYRHLANEPANRSSFPDCLSACFSAGQRERERDSKLQKFYMQVTRQYLVQISQMTSP